MKYFALINLIIKIFKEKLGEICLGIAAEATIKEYKYPLVMSYTSTYFLVDPKWESIVTAY